MTDPATASAWPPRRTQPAAALRPAPETGNGTHLGELHLVDPLEVFAGLAAACVPAFCDGLRFDLATEGGQQLNVSFPLAADDATGSGGSHDAHREDGAPPDGHGGEISIAIASEPTADEAPIAGTLTCTWLAGDRPTEADALMARLLADQALARIRMVSLSSALHQQRVRAANLEQALATNREIGQAIGILMATDHLTATQAFERLRTASQHSHRKLRDIAADVTETGVLAAAAPARTQNGAAKPGAAKPSGAAASLGSDRTRAGITAE